MTYREKRERRAEKREDWAEKRQVKSEAAFAASHQLANQIPLGQPILVGHHSEKKARRDQDRIFGGMVKGVEHSHMATHHAQAADTIRKQLDRSIYRDDDDAIERLSEKIADLEEKQARRKAINTWLQKNSGVPRRKLPFTASAELEQKAAKALADCFREMELTADERKDCMLALQMNCTLGYPTYALSNISATIRKEQKRLVELQTAA